MGPGRQFLGDQNQVAPARYDRNAMTVAGFVGPNKASRCPGTKLFQQQTAQCAKGSTKYDMQVRVDNFKLANTGMVMLIGDNHEIAAQVKLVNAENNGVAAEYYVQETTSGGGLIGLAKLSGGSRAISGDFASSVCAKVFGKK